MNKEKKVSVSKEKKTQASPINWRPRLLEPLSMLPWVIGGNLNLLELLPTRFYPKQFDT